MYAEDVSGSGRRKINQGFLMLVALDAREQPFQLLAVAAADAEERTLHLYQDTCLTTTHASPLHSPLYRSKRCRTRRSYGASCAP